MCNHCHPDFVFSGSGCSKIACKYFDALETKLGICTKNGGLVLNIALRYGNRNPLMVIILTHLTAVPLPLNFWVIITMAILVFWGDGEQCDRWFRKFKDLFVDTEAKLTKFFMSGRAILTTSLKMQ
jgi:hypothetical protein